MTELQEKVFDIIKLSMQYMDVSDEELEADILAQDEETLLKFVEESEV